MKCYLILIVAIGLHLNGYTQKNIEVTYLINGNATLSNMIPASQVGGTTYDTPFAVTSLSHNFEIGYGKNKSKWYVSCNFGQLAPIWEYSSYPDKYIYDNPIVKVYNKFETTPDTFMISMQEFMGYRGIETKSIQTLKLSLLHKYIWHSGKKIDHKSVLGVGVLSVRTKKSSSISRTEAFIDNNYYGSETFWIEGLDTVKNFSYTSKKYQFYGENWSLNFCLGYELSYKVSNKINLNVQVTYNQGLRQMMRWNQIHEYSESATGYSEKSVQWFTSKLSHVSFALGLSYKFGNSASEK